MSDARGSAGGPEDEGDREGREDRSPTPRAGRPRVSGGGEEGFFRSDGPGSAPRRPGEEPTADREADAGIDLDDPTRPAARMTFRGAPATIVLILFMGALELLATLDFSWRELLIGQYAFDPITIYGVYVGAMSASELLPLVTHVFLHGGLLHLAFNMLALTVLGPPIERALGSFVYVLVFVLLGIGGGLGHSAWEWAQFFFSDGHDRLAGLVGASGAIFGLLGVDLGRRARALQAIPPAYRVSSPGRYLLRASTGVVLVNVVMMLMPIVISGAAHLGGFFLGLALAFLLFRPGGARTL